MSAINAIYNANVYIDGNSLLGNASEFKLPEFEFGQDEYTGLGLIGTIKLPNGVEAWRVRSLGTAFILKWRRRHPTHSRPCN